MKVKTYIRVQNQIFEYHFGITLVPEEQIAETVVTKEMVLNMKTFIKEVQEGIGGQYPVPLAPTSMPYCSAYLREDCVNCPMSGQENKCELPGSTYNECCNAMDGMRAGSNPLVIELVALAEKFVHSNRHLLLDNEEYFDRKNSLFLKHTGLILIPEDQIINTPVTKQMVSEMEYFILVAEELFIKQGGVPVSKNNCPYCTLHNTKETKYDCRGCPMDEADNNCKLEGTTVEACEEYLENHRESIKPLALDLIKLAKEYIEANKEAVNDTPGILNP